MLSNLVSHVEKQFILKYQQPLMRNIVTIKEGKMVLQPHKLKKLLTPPKLDEDIVININRDAIKKFLLYSCLGGSIFGGIYGFHTGAKYGTRSHRYQERDRFDVIFDGTAKGTVCAVAGFLWPITLPIYCISSFYVKKNF